MGWYLKKSFAFGPLRLNLSKSGLGASAGVKGLRVSTGPKGRQLNAGRGGLYYRTSLSRPGPIEPETAQHEMKDFDSGTKRSASPKPKDGLMRFVRGLLNGR